MLLCSVSVRVRPLSEQEAEKGAAWRIENNKIVPLTAATSQYASENAYTLDYVFGSEWSTQAVYERTTEDIIKKVVGGFNGTVFAYGQTSSGKTHTMRGTEKEPGIIPLAVAEIFRQIHSLQDREFLLRVSYMEVIPQHKHAPYSKSLMHQAAAESEVLCIPAPVDSIWPGTCSSTMRR